MSVPIKVWIQAARLRTLPLAFSTILMGAFLAWEGDQFNGIILALSLLTTLFLQVLSNFANDYGDYHSGVDGEERTGPSRTIQSGLISKGQMKNAIIVFAVLSLISGIVLLLTAFPENWILVMVFLIIGIGAIAAAIKYTVGNNPYGYIGLGDLFVLIFFGFVGVGGTYFLFTKTLDLQIILPALTCGLLSVGVLNVNNIRDIESDKASGKFSIPVRLGKPKAIIYHWGILLLSMLCILYYAFINSYELVNYIFIFSFPLIIRNGVAISKLPSDKLDPFLKQLAITTLLFVILFGVNVFLTK